MVGWGVGSCFVFCVLLCFGLFPALLFVVCFAFRCFALLWVFVFVVCSAFCFALGFLLWLFVKTFEDYFSKGVLGAVFYYVFLFLVLCSALFCSLFFVCVCVPLRCSAVADSTSLWRSPSSGISLSPSLAVVA